MRARADWLAARPSHALTAVISTGDMLRDGADATEALAQREPRCPGCGETRMIEPIAGSLPIAGSRRFYCHVCSRTWRHAEADR
jgi:transposase-like protein